MFNSHPTQPTEPPVSQSVPKSTDIRVMPEKFLRSKNKIRIPRFVWIGLGVLFLAGLAVFIVLWQQGLFFQPAQKPPVKEKPIVVEKPTPLKAPEEPIKPAFPLISPAQTLEEEVKDEEGNLVGSAKLVLPEESLDPPEAKIFLTGSLPRLEEKDHPQYQIIGGVYQIKSKEPVSFLKVVDLILKYDQKILEDYKVDEIKLEMVSLRKEGWQIEESELDIVNKEVKIILQEFSPYSYALVIPKELIKQETKPKAMIETTLPSSLDTDKDGLTDEEEILYRTRKDLNDTDQDSYPDGLEIVNLYNPLSGPGDRLALSGLINSYTNPVYNYTLYYPSSWIVKALDESNREIIFTSATREFIEIIIQDNPHQLSVLDWYLEVSPGIESFQVKTSNINNQQVVWSADGQTLYLAQGDKIYGLIYNSGIREDLNFKATFGMMIKSFRIM